MSAQDQGLDDLIAKLGSAESAPAGKPSPALQDEPVPEFYRRAIYPLSLGFSMAANYGLNFVGCEFVPISRDQAAQFEEDAAYCLKEAVDSWVPQFAKDHPRLTAFVLTAATVCAVNVRAKQQPKPADPVKEKKPVPSVHTVTIDTAEGKIGGMNEN